MVTRTTPKAGDPVTSGSRQRPDGGTLGAALRRAWVGYQQMLEEQMAASGVRRRNFPDGRVLHICARSSDTTISKIGRELGITRQGASKVVRTLRDQGFVRLQASPDDGREKLVALTRTATTYLEAQRHSARLIERRLKAEIGDDAFRALYDLLELLGGTDIPRLREFLRTRHGAMQVE